jgi:hypothetical protein
MESIKSQMNATDIPLQVSFLPVDRSLKPRANLAISVEAFEQGLILTGQPFRIAAAVHNDRSAPVENIQVTLKVSNTTIGEREVSVPANGVTQVAFECRIDSAGSHELTFSIDDPDGLSGDNSAFHVIQVRSPVRVLLVDDRADAPEFERPSGFLALALAPFQGPDSSKNLAQCKTVRPNQFRPADLDQQEVVILANVSRLADDVALAMANYVHNGGALMIFSGDQIDVAWYNTRWGKQASQPLMPFDFTLPRPDFATQSPTSVAPIQKSMLTALERAVGGDVATWDIQHWLQLVNDTTDATSKNSEHVSHTIMELANGLPLLVERTQNKGHVLQFAISPDDKWTNLPNRPSFVPLIHSLIHWLITERDVQRNVVAGQTIAIDRLVQTKNFKNIPANAKTSDNQQSLSITVPGQERQVHFNAADGDQFTETSRPGFYRVTADASSTGSESFAVNLPLTESQLEFLDWEQLKSIGNAIGATVAASSEELLALGNLRSNGREIWRWVLVGLIALIFAELWLQQRISKVTL